MGSTIEIVKRLHRISGSQNPETKRFLLELAALISAGEVKVATTLCEGCLGTRQTHRGNCPIAYTDALEMRTANELLDIRTRLQAIERWVEDREDEESDNCDHDSFSAEGDCHGCGYPYSEIYPNPPIVVGDKVYMVPNPNPIGEVLEVNAKRQCLIDWGSGNPPRPTSMWLLRKVDGEDAAG